MNLNLRFPAQYISKKLTTSPKFSKSRQESNSWLKRNASDIVVSVFFIIQNYPTNYAP